MTQTFNEYTSRIYLIRTSSHKVILNLLDHEYISLKGRFEVMIFCGVYFLSHRYRNNPDLWDLSNAYFRELINDYKKFEIGYFEHFKLSGIINKRTQMYQDEIRLLHNKGMPGKTFSAFYEFPLSSSPEFTENMPSLLMFMPALASVVHFMSEVQPFRFSTDK